MLSKHGRCSQGDLYKHAPFSEDFSYDTIGTWIESAIDRGLISRQQEAGMTLYALADKGEAALHG